MRISKYLTDVIHIVQLTTLLLSVLKLLQKQKQRKIKIKKNGEFYSQIYLKGLVIFLTHCIFDLNISIIKLYTVPVFG